MISAVRESVSKFLKETIEVEGVRIISIERNDDEGGWIVEAEVAEINHYLASIKPEYRVFDKEHYIVKLDSELEISSYKRGRISEEAL